MSQYPTGVTVHSQPQPQQQQQPQVVVVQNPSQKLIDVGDDPSDWYCMWIAAFIFGLLSLCGLCCVNPTYEHQKKRQRAKMIYYIILIVSLILHSIGSYVWWSIALKEGMKHQAYPQSNANVGGHQAHRTSNTDVHHKIF